VNSTDFGSRTTDARAPSADTGAQDLWHTTPSIPDRNLQFIMTIIALLGGQVMIHKDPRKTCTAVWRTSYEDWSTPSIVFTSSVRQDKVKGGSP